MRRGRATARRAPQRRRTGRTAGGVSASGAEPGCLSASAAPTAGSDGVGRSPRGAPLNRGVAAGAGGPVRGHPGRLTAPVSPPASGARSGPDRRTQPGSSTRSSSLQHRASGDDAARVGGPQPVPFDRSGHRVRDLGPFLVPGPGSTMAACRSRTRGLPKARYRIAIGLAVGQRLAPAVTQPESPSRATRRPTRTPPSGPSPGLTISVRPRSST